MNPLPGLVRRMCETGGIMKLKTFNLITAAALVLGLSPAIASAHPLPITGGHARQTSFHDHTPHVHDHTPVAHH
jgi:hypothetical protein